MRLDEKNYVRIVQSERKNKKKMFFFSTTTFKPFGIFFFPVFCQRFVCLLNCIGNEKKKKKIERERNAKNVICKSKSPIKLLLKTIHI